MEYLSLIYGLHVAILLAMLFAFIHIAGKNRGKNNFRQFAKIEEINDKAKFFASARKIAKINGWEIYDINDNSVYFYSKATFFVPEFLFCAYLTNNMVELKSSQKSIGYWAGRKKKEEVFEALFTLFISE